MKLVDNSGQILKYSWTVRLCALAAVCQTLAQLWPLVEPQVASLVSPQVFSVLSLLFTAAAIVARVIHQTVLHQSNDEEGKQ
ncbi:MAG TPA: hypothetical protein VFV57_05920 [Limnobacter sp.]|nr:hypothetical protein [Limnobacter sp.]